MEKLHIYLADPGIRVEQLDAIRKTMPENWSLVDKPDGAVALLTENVDIHANILDQASSLRVIFRLVPGNAVISSTDVPVYDLSNTGLIGVAEHVVALILALSRHLLWVARKAAAHEWVTGRDQPILTDQKKYTFNWIGLENSGAIYGKKVGIVGLGYIGQAVARRLRPFGVRLLYTDLKRFDPELEKELGVEWRSLEGLLRESDFITLHLRFVDGTGGNENMFGKQQFDLMKSNAFFINTSRGRMVDESALVEALRSKKIAGAGLDVFHYEPLPHDHPLLTLAGDSVILTAHTAGTYNPEAWQTTADEIVERLKDLI
jgi:glyoxylate reductase